MSIYGVEKGLWKILCHKSNEQSAIAFKNEQKDHLNRNRDKQDYRESSLYSSTLLDILE